MSEYRLSHAALTELDGLWLYIATDSADAADRTVDKILTACERLAETPGIGHVRDDLTDEDVRFFSVGKYLLVYWPNSRPLEIIRILHGARDVRRILSDL